MRYVDPDGRSAKGAVLGWTGTDTLVPDPTDAVIWKWLGYGVAFLGAVILDIFIVETVSEAIDNTVNNEQKTYFSKSNSGATSPSPLPPDPDDEENLEYESNPKHHQNARGNISNEPPNAKEMFQKSVKDPKNSNTRWYRDKNGDFHRFQGSNNKYHWNGSTNTGIRLENVPIELRRNLPKGEF